jgi:hypothetical protein
MLKFAPRSLTAASRRAAVLTLLSPAFVLLGSVLALDPGHQLERGLHTAAVAETRLLAEAVVPAVPSSATRTAIAARGPQAGSEEFWLTRAPAGEAIARVAWTAPVAPGDRIVVNLDAATRHVLDVVAVDTVGADTTRIDTGAAADTRFVLTCRKVADPDAALVRLTVDAQGRGITMVGAGDRTL